MCWLCTWLCTGLGLGFLGGLGTGRASCCGCGQNQCNNNQQCNRNQCYQQSPYGLYNNYYNYQNYGYRNNNSCASFC